jgi:stress-induced morphogen
MLTVDQIKAKIENGLPGSQVEMQDPRNDGVHLKAIVVFEGFKGKRLLEQHRMVYETLKKELKEELHALALETKVE